jgi:hypothetical protein
VVADLLLPSAIFDFNGSMIVISSLGAAIVNNISLREEI